MQINSTLLKSALKPTGGLVMAAALAGLFSLTSFTASNEAEARRYNDGYDYIKVTSRFSPNKQVVVAVRRARGGGREVRLPSGTWIPCEGPCHWTVQKEYLDFWEWQQQKFGPGYFRWER